MQDIVIHRARTHNLKNVSLRIPREKLTVITGLSGSGKSSLAFDTLYAEGQRRYVESLSAYARQFLELMPRPDVDAVEGLSPAIAIDQKGVNSNPRSTVGTTTEITDYMRLLFARVGVPHCPVHKQALTMDSVARIVDNIINLLKGERILLGAPLIRSKTGDFTKVFEKAFAEGYIRFRVDGEVVTPDAPMALDDGHPHDVDLIVDRLRVDETARTRLADSVERAAGLSGGRVMVDQMDGDMHYVASTRYVCPECDYTLPKLEPAMFSPNSPQGCCPECQGTGVASAFDVANVVKAPGLSIRLGAVHGWDERSQRKFARMQAVLSLLGASPDVPWQSLPEEVREVVLHGDERTRAMTPPFVGVMTELEDAWNDDPTDSMREALKSFRSPVVCPVCHGRRLRTDVLSVFVGDGEARYAIDQLDSLSLSELRTALMGLEFSEARELVARKVVDEIVARLTFLENVGLGYLNLGRRSDTLSGGESQRIRLASQIGSGLTGVLYVLDEPSIGLHQRDNARLINSLKALRDLGNTLIVVEHDEETIREADYVVDVGPGAGEHGGEIIATGTPEEIMADPDSLTGQYLSGTRRLEAPLRAGRPTEGWVTLKGARGHNLKDVDFRFPVGLMTVVTGISGSGKSTLVIDTLHAELARALNRAKSEPLPFDSIENEQAFDKVIMVDQSPIGRTPRSNPATYTGVFSQIRDVFAKTRMSRERGYGPGRFSFNVKGGRCEACQGDGVIKMEMHFLPDVYVPCEQCRGRRYNRETLEVKYKGLDISEVLDLTVEEAHPLFSAYPKIERSLKALIDVGLGYIRLGQSATTFSGGEAQRIKLATELARPDSGRTLYILDEPTTGLHFHDIAQLIDVLRQLMKQGNTVLVIEHNLDMVKNADWVVDMGPDGGSEGGRILFEGTPRALARAKGTVTGPYLARVLDGAADE